MTDCKLENVSKLTYNLILLTNKPEFDKFTPFEKMTALKAASNILRDMIESEAVLEMYKRSLEKL